MDTMAMQQQEETMSRTMSPRTELPGFQTIAEMQTTQRTSIGLCDDTPIYINPAAETLLRLVQSLSYTSYVVQEQCGMRFDCRNVINFPNEHLHNLLDV